MIGQTNKECDPRVNGIYGWMMERALKLMEGKGALYISNLHVRTLIGSILYYVVDGTLFL